MDPYVEVCFAGHKVSFVIRRPDGYFNFLPYMIALPNDANELHSI